MRYLSLPLALFSVALLITACGEKPKPTPTPEPKKDVTAELKEAITEFGKSPSTSTAAEVTKAFAYYDIELSDLKIDLDSTPPDQLSELQTEIARMEKVRDEQKKRYMKLRVENGMAKAADHMKDAGESIKDAAQSTGDAIEEAGEELKEAISN